MTPPPMLLDTDVLSALMRKNPAVVRKAQSYLSTHHRFTLSIITRYEILRGLKAKGATKQGSAFDHFCARNSILPLTDDVIVKAAGIYADLYQRGALIGDADILIAASAMAHGLGVVTNNESHFKRIIGLYIDNWLS